MKPEQTAEHPTLTQYQGAEIISTEPAIGPHPRTKEPASFRTALRVLLADGRETFICPYGDYDHPTSVMSVNNHYNSAHIKREFRRYRPEVLRAIVRAVSEAKASPGRDFMDRAAVILNARGLRTVSNEPWSASNVSAVYRKYGAEFERQHGGARRGAGRPEGSKSRATTPRAVAAGVTRAVKAPRSLEGLRALAVSMVQEIDALIENGAGEVDPELVRKAAKWDAFVALRDDH